MSAAVAALAALAAASGASGASGALRHWWHWRRSEGLGGGGSRVRQLFLPILGPQLDFLEQPDVLVRVVEGDERLFSSTTSLI